MGGEFVTTNIVQGPSLVHYDYLRTVHSGSQLPPVSVQNQDVYNNAPIHCLNKCFGPLDLSRLALKKSYSKHLQASLIVSTGFDFVTPTPPLQCVERFHRYRSNEKNIIASLLKFAGYIHSHKILPGNIFGLILKNKMAAMGVFRLK